MLLHIHNDFDLLQLMDPLFAKLLMILSNRYVNVFNKLDIP
jgi:hypothetical protein